MANKSGRSRTQSRLKSARQEKSNARETFSGTKRTAKASLEKCQAAVLHSASSAISNARHLSAWGPEYTKQAQDYLHALVYGPPVDEAKVARMHQLARRVAEQRFATACWFKRHMLNELTLPGMKNINYKSDYAEARTAYPNN